MKAITPRESYKDLIAKLIENFGEVKEAVTIINEAVMEGTITDG